MSRLKESAVLLFLVLIAFLSHVNGFFFLLASGYAHFDVSSTDSVPPLITHLPITHGVALNPIQISAIVTDDVMIVEVYLYYKRTGELNYCKVVMAKCPTCKDTYNATISASNVTTPTIQYYVNATDGTNFSTDPATNPTVNPHVITINLFPASVALNQPSEITVNSMKLSWTESVDSDFKNYTIYQSNKQGNLGTQINAITARSTITYTVAGLSENATYYFTIRVFDTGGLGADSNQVVGKTLESSSGTGGLPWIPIGAGLVIIAVVIVIMFVFVKRKKNTK